MNLQSQARAKLEACAENISRENEARARGMTGCECGELAARELSEAKELLRADALDTTKTD